MFFRRIAVIGLLMGLALGCAKKTKFTGDTNDSASVPPKPVVPAKPSDMGDKKKADGVKPNWLDDPRFKDKHGDQLPVENDPGKPGWGLNVPAPPPGNAANPQQPMGNPQPQPAAPPAAGTTTGFPNLKPVSEADMKEVWIFIENASGASGKMPTSALVIAALQQAKSSAAPLVIDGSITLTGAKARESVWAYETKGKINGGWVATQNGVENLTAAELARRLGK